NENRIYDKAVEQLKKSNNKQMINVICMNSIKYTACFIDSQKIYKGIYILGPHSCTKNNPLNIPDKPMCLMSNLVSLLYIIEKDINHQGRRFKNQYSYHVRKALDYIDSRYNEDITLLDLASYLDVHKSYMCTLLKKETGKTFTQILNEVRVEKSKGLL